MESELGSRIVKYLKRKKIFVNGTKRVTFDPYNMTAYSYGWWQFVACINGTVYWNNATYSNTTAKHKRDVSRILFSMPIKPTINVNAPQGFQDIDGSVTCLNERIKLLNDAIGRKNSRAGTNAGRQMQIVALKTDIVMLLTMKQGVVTPYPHKLDLSKFTGEKESNMERLFYNQKLKRVK